MTSSWLFARRRDTPRFVSGGTGRWGVRRALSERGLPRRLLVLTDLSRTLREEERNAWQRLVRASVTGNE